MEKGRRQNEVLEAERLFLRISQAFRDRTYARRQQVCQLPHRNRRFRYAGHVYVWRSPMNEQADPYD